MSRFASTGHTAAALCAVARRALWVAFVSVLFASSSWSDEAPQYDVQPVPTEAAPAAPAPPEAGEPEVAPSEPEGSAIETIFVTGREIDPSADYSVDLDRVSPATPDAASYVKLIPGADVVFNGPIVGQVQYRGLWGTRTNVTIDSMRIDPGGPNWMDPPLQYAPRVLLESIELSRGIASISAGPETIGAAARAELMRSEFAESDELEFGTSVEVGSRSADANFSTGGIAEVATRSQRAHVLGSYERGSDYRAPEGRVRPTEYERQSYGGGYGFRLGDQQVGADYRHQDVDDTGTPALPMDIRFLDTELLSGGYDATFGVFDVEAFVSWSDIQHRMDNYSLRNAPPPPMQRFSDARGKNVEYDLSVSYPAYTGEIEVGTDGFFTRHDQYVFSPVDPGFFVRNFKNSERDRYSVFFEWAGQASDPVGMEFGFRYTRVKTDSGTVDSTPSQTLPPPMRLRDAFNAADRKQVDDHFDYVVKLDWAPTDGLILDIGTSRKTRSPYYIERYAWLPIEVTAGLADGNNYVGRIGLDQEIAYEIEGGVGWQWKWLYLAPRAYYRKVNDYIQGVPATNPDVITVSTLNGDPTPLQFANVEAEFYGVDAEFAVDLPLGLVLDGTISWVRGKRRDIDDDLYRIVPLTGRTTLTYRRDTWSISIEGLYAGAQDHVSRTNGETPSSRYAILNLFGNWDFAEGWRLTAGIDNVTDNLYRPHLSGINRVTGSATDVGQRLPGLGVNAYGRISYTF